MPMILRDYQDFLKIEIYRQWDLGHKNVLAVMPTGMGKTKTFCSIAIDLAISGLITELLKEKLQAHGGVLPTAIMVHRKELVQQISITLAEEGIVHGMIAQPATIKGIEAAHRRVLKKSFYRYGAPITVISVDTLNSQIDKHRSWAKNVKFWITDEAAHVLRENKWGEAAGYFVNAIGLGVTATPERLDKKGLGRHADGIFDVKVEGPSTRWGILEGYLCKYRVAVPETDYNEHLGDASNGSDFSKQTMAMAAKKSRITGDVVTNYRKYADGKQAIIFASDMESAQRMEENFNFVGIPAKLLTSKSTDEERLNGLIDFRNKKIKVLINIDLFDEGLDVPGIDVVILARPTMSLSKFLQMVGRGLRPVYASGWDLRTREGRLGAQANGTKPHAIIIDHVGNFDRHGPPDLRRMWTLDSTKGERRKAIKLMRTCWNWETCGWDFERVLTHCPFCNEPAIDPNKLKSGRGSPAEVDGDLVLIDPETRWRLEKATELEDPGVYAARIAAAGGGHAGQRAMEYQVERIKVQKELYQAIALWSGNRKHFDGYTDPEIHKLFYSNHQMTINEALALKTVDMKKIMSELK